MPRPIGVFACDSFDATRVGIRSMLDQEDMQILGTAATVDECIATAPHESIDVYVLGLNQNDPSGSLIRTLRKQHKNTGIVAYGTDAQTHFVTMIYEAGANAYVPKSSDPTILVEAVRTVAEGKHYWAAGIAEAIATFFVTGGFFRSNPKHILTTGELKLFLLLASGSKPKEAAERLGIAATTARNRSVTIRKKLGIQRSEFERVAKEYGLI